MSATSAADVKDSDTITIDTRLLGEISIPAASVYTFPTGLPGFEAQTRFALIPAAGAHVFWLQSLDEPGLAFVMADPFVAIEGYEVDLKPSELRELGLEQASDALVFVIVTLPAVEQDSATANFRGPVVLNTRTRTGRQVVSAADTYDIHTPFNLRALVSGT